jgi:hypothetical protein
MFLLYYLSMIMAPFLAHNMNTLRFIYMLDYTLRFARFYVAFW